MRIKKLISILGVFALAAAAAPIATSAQAEESDAAVTRDIRVTVVNNNWADVRVYAVSSSYTVRLGTVSALGRSTFKLPRALPAYTGDFQLVVRPIGQRGVHYSQPILASAGDTIEFTVQNHLGLSSAIVY